MKRSAIDILIDRAGMRCVKCGHRSGTCDCWVECRCGHSYARGEACRNPVHGVEAAAKEMAEGIVLGVLNEMRSLYPEPMKHASGGFRKTLKVIMEREFADALTHWMMAKTE